MREIPRQPGLGPNTAPARRAAHFVHVSQFTQRASAGDTGEAKPLSPLPTDDQVFNAIPNRWNYQFPEYHRYPQGEVPYLKGHWYDPFNQNKLKGDYPIIGNQTFLNVSLHQRYLRRWPPVAGAERPRLGQSRIALNFSGASVNSS